MKWTRAVHHLKELAETCADMADRPIFPLRVRQLWAVGELLGAPADLDWITVALCVDLPAEEVPWWSEPPGAQHWANATRLAKNPVVAWWRSVHSPVWNHRIVRPALVWDADAGIDEGVLAAIRGGRGEAVRTAAPPAEECRARLADELAISLRALRDRTREYDERRWAPGRLDPVADALWRATDGYLDVLAAVEPVDAGP